jgi:hypothetical protein
MITCTEEELLWLFNQVHGEMTGSCHAEVIFNDNDSSIVQHVALVKDGDVCWTASKEDLLVSYLFARHARR